MRFLGLDHRAQGGAIEHVDDMAAMGDLHGWRIGVTVDCNHFNAKALQLDDHLLAQLTAAT
ncbi:hypothetical protein D3C80_2050480 [compost metagenome]